MIDDSKQAPFSVLAAKYGISEDVYKALRDENCQVEPVKSIDDAMDPEDGSIIAVAFGSN